MKLGISYLVFQGHEFLNPLVDIIRDHVDFISVIYQETSYYGFKVNPDIFKHIQSKNIDKIICFHPDLNLHPKDNELIARNLGREASLINNCSHHISSDVDEFYIPTQFQIAKETFDDDCSLVSLENYYKDPRFLITPNQGQQISFIQKADIPYDSTSLFPYKIEKTRKPKLYQKCKIYSPNEIVCHHMSYVRKDIRAKLNNTINGRNYNIDKFVELFNTYKVGDKLNIAPDFRTVPKNL